MLILPGAGCASKGVRSTESSSTSDAALLEPENTIQISGTPDSDDAGTIMVSNQQFVNRTDQENHKANQDTTRYRQAWPRHSTRHVPSAWISQHIRAQSARESDHSSQASSVVGKFRTETTS